MVHLYGACAGIGGFNRPAAVSSCVSEMNVFRFSACILRADANFLRIRAIIGKGEPVDCTQVKRG